jgi:GNAT superfamily N-acetyltransferase
MLAFRYATAVDLRFVCDAWSRSYANSWTRSPIEGRAAFGFAPASTWVAIGLEQAKRLVAEPSVTTVVAYEDEAWAADADIYGFIAADMSEPPPLVLYTFVKQPFRRRGFARALFAAAGIDPGRAFRYLAETRSSQEIATAGKIPLAKFDPAPTRAKEQRA